MTSIDRRLLRRARHDVCQTWRARLIAEGGIEVTTPILNAHPDIAPVRQFTTRHPRTGEPSCLRIAPTEYLKRLLADGEERIFEFSLNFRDDLSDETHLPEFMSLEYMAVDTTCIDMEELAVELLSVAASQLTHLDPHEPPQWVLQLATGRVTRVSIADLLDIGTDLNPEELDRVVVGCAKEVGGVVFMADFPESLGGPAVAHPELSGFKQRTELYVDGLEIANMSSTLIEPKLLERWHETSLVRKDALGIVPNTKDIALFNAVNKGIPKSAVIGLGVERVLQAYFRLENMSREFNHGY